MAQLQLGFPPPPGFDAHDFVVSAPNLEAWTALMQAAPEGLGAAALVGPSGSGKSHLAAAWAARVGATRMDATAPVEELSAAPFMLAEDVNGGFVDATLFHLINLGRRPGCALVLTARTPPRAWETTLPDLRSRLNSLPMLPLAEPDDAILEGMLLKLFRERRIRASQDLLSYLVRRIDRSAEAARAAVRALDERASAAGRAVNRRLAVEVFGAGADSEGG